MVAIVPLHRLAPPPCAAELHRRAPRAGISRRSFDRAARLRGGCPIARRPRRLFPGPRILGVPRQSSFFVNLPRLYSKCRRKPDMAINGRR